MGEQPEAGKSQPSTASNVTIKPENEPGAEEHSSQDPTEQPIPPDSNPVSRALAVLRHWFAKLSTVNWRTVGTVSFTLAIIAFILFVVRPFASEKDEIAQNVALAWNGAIRRLGMEPLYPPREDFYVGDLYLTIEPIDPNVRSTLPDYPTEVFAGKGVKIGHIDLRPEILALPSIRFADTAVSGSSPLLVQPKVEVREDAHDRLIYLSEVSFPGVEITWAADRSGGLPWLSASRRGTSEGKIVISGAQTYSAQIPDAIVKLQNYCADEQTSGFCSDAVARRIMTYVLGSDVTAVHQSKYIFGIGINLVTQVYMSREFDISRTEANSTAFSAGRGARKVTTPVTPSDPKVNTQAPAGAEEEASASAVSDEQQGNQADLLQSARSSLEMTGVRAKPLVFGFRSVSFPIQRSKPEK